MLSPKRLVEKAKKGLPLMRSNSRSSSCDFNNILIADKGHFVVYTMDDARFVVPLSFLKSCIFQELLKVSAEEFGLPGEGPITLACSGVFLEYVVSLLKRSLSRDVELALLVSIDANRCSKPVLRFLVGKLPTTITPSGHLAMEGKEGPATRMQEHGHGLGPLSLSVICLGFFQISSGLRADDSKHM
ncbi:hypothetical protein ZIOFF_044014 [Zingiber officinale]|uniref:Uncharacterized protein n=1 Tax=Zingiber officinale TaxID=94328 RepID=A0A8J5KZZ0_ZINOF|nr:hypothetical protein ZIOFF_044014 [Zingiber officinale]